MSFWDIFNNKDKAQEKIGSQLHQKLSILLPNTEEKELKRITCIAGLLARVAYTDMNYHDQEILQMEVALQEWSSLSKHDIKAVIKLTRAEIIQLSGLENHLYCYPLNEILTIDDKFSLIKALFAVAASDNSVDAKETEEIRIISHGLCLEHKYFIAAKATVLEHLKALKPH